MVQLDELSIEEKIGQLFLVRFSDKRINSNMISLIAHYKIGGVVYENNHFTNTKQIHHLSLKLQHATKKSLPLFIGIKEINDLPNHVTKSFSQKEIGYLNNLLYTKQMAEIHGKELQTLGINMYFGPHLQVMENDPHCFGKDTAYITRHATAAMKGFQRENIIANVQADHYFDLLKQSNQHQTTTLARHVSKLMAEMTMMQLEANNAILPFVRNDMLFDGIILSNCKEMDDPVQILQDGADLLFFEASEDVVRQKVDQTIEAVNENKLSMAVIDRAVKRIIRLKSVFALDELPSWKQAVFHNKHAHNLTNKIKQLI